MTINNERLQSARVHSKYCAQQLAANIIIKENTNNKCKVVICQEGIFLENVFVMAQHVMNQGQIFMFWKFLIFTV